MVAAPKFIAMLTKILLSISRVVLLLSILLAAKDGWRSEMSISFSYYWVNDMKRLDVGTESSLGIGLRSDDVVGTRWKLTEGIGSSSKGSEACWEFAGSLSKGLAFTQEDR
ncbi:hypothetical protein BHM03_00010736 [Ensete ventricosum]|uniref:Uncharacterized protein n=1 Tax=Ensete ventricosum TaxID=4639 RepID=A0A445MD66_ENSVE|nr:hypothetical protein BHM03_00010736 [Ensete ventricosum]